MEKLNPQIFTKRLAELHHTVAQSFVTSYSRLYLRTFDGLKHFRCQNTRILIFPLFSLNFPLGSSFFFFFLFALWLTTLRNVQYIVCRRRKSIWLFSCICFHCEKSGVYTKQTQFRRKSGISSTKLSLVYLSIALCFPPPLYHFLFFFLLFISAPSHLYCHSLFLFFSPPSLSSPFISPSLGFDTRTTFNVLSRINSPWCLNRTVKDAFTLFHTHIGSVIKRYGTKLRVLVLCRNTTQFRKS